MTQENNEEPQSVDDVLDNMGGQEEPKEPVRRRREPEPDEEIDLMEEGAERKLAQRRPRRDTDRESTRADAEREEDRERRRGRADREYNGGYEPPRRPPREPRVEYQEPYDEHREYNPPGFADDFEDAGYDEFGRPVDTGGGGSKLGGKLGGFKIPSAPGQIIITAVGLSILLMLIIGLTPLKGYVGMGVDKNEIASIADERIVNAITPIQTAQNSYATSISTLQSDVNTLESTAVSSSDLGGFVSSGTLNSYVSKSQLTTELTSYATLADLTDADISALQAELEQLVAQTQQDVNAALALAMIDIREAAGNISAGIEYGLRGSANDYWLSVESAEDGEYCGYITMIWRVPPLLNGGGNYTDAMADFYGSLNSPNRVYVPKLTANTAFNEILQVWEVTGWKLAEVVFFTSKFALEAGEGVEFHLPVRGLDAFQGYEIYCSILKANVPVGGSGGGSI